MYHATFPHITWPRFSHVFLSERCYNCHQADGRLPLEDTSSTARWVPITHSPGPGKCHIKPILWPSHLLKFFALPASRFKEVSITFPGAGLFNATRKCRNGALKFAKSSLHFRKKCKATGRGWRKVNREMGNGKVGKWGNGWGTQAKAKVKVQDQNALGKNSSQQFVATAWLSPSF